MNTATLCYNEPIFAEAILWDGTNFEEIEEFLETVVKDDFIEAELDNRSPKVLHVRGSICENLTLIPGNYLCYASFMPTESFHELFIVPKDEVEDGTWELGVQS